MTSVHLRHRFRTGLVALLVGAACAQAAAQGPTPDFESQCITRLAATRIDVSALPSDVRYDFSLSVPALTNKGTRQRDLGQHVLGLTEAVLRTELKWGSNALVDPKSGLACMRPRLEIRLSVGPQQVYIGKEFPKGSCAFHEVVRHELRHVYANQNGVERAADKMQAELSDFFGQRIFYGEAAALTRQLEQAIRESWLPRVKAELDRVHDDHNRIDSPAEYARSSTMCGGIVPKILRASGAMTR